MIREQLTRTSTRGVLLVAITLCLAVGLVFVPGAVAQTDSPTDDDPSPVPAAYYGSVTVVGDADVDGIEVTAEVEGTEYGPLVTDADGDYGGGAAADEKLVIDPEEAPDDPQVTFFIESDEIDRTEVTQTDPRPVEWEEGATQQVDLTVVLDDQDLPNLATTVQADDEQQLEDGLEAEVLVENLGETSTGESAQVVIDAEGSPFESEDTVELELNEEVGELEPDESETIDISDELSTWAQDNEIVDDVVLTSEADPADEIQESTLSTNIDQTTTDVTYLDLTADAATRDSVVEGQNIALRSFITNDGTADIDARDVNVTVENGDEESYEFGIDGLAAGDQFTDRTRKSFDTAGTYTMTVEIDEEATDILIDDYTATSTFDVEPYNLTLRDADEMRVPEEVSVDSNFTATFFYETNASEPVDAQIDLPAQIETSETEIKTVDSSTGNNTVSWRLSATETTDDEVSIDVDIEDTLGLDETDNVTVNTSVPRVTDRISNTSNVVLSDGESEDTTELRVSDRETFEQNVTLTLEGGAEGRTLSGLEYLVRYPYGCVEQTTSSFLGALNTKQYYEDRDDYDIDEDRFEDINGSIEEGIERLEAGGVRGQLGEDGDDERGWNFWGRQNADSDTFATSYALLGVSSVAEDDDYDSGNIDFEGAVGAIEADQGPDGEFDAFSYFRDKNSMTGFTMVTLNQTVIGHDDTTSSDVAPIQANASAYLVSQQQNSGAWQDHDSFWNDPEDSATSTGLAIWGLQTALDNDEIDWSEVDTTESEVEDAVEDGHAWLIENQEMDDEDFQGSWDSYHDSTWWNRQGDTSEEAAFATYGLDATDDTVGDLEVEVDGHGNRTTQDAVDNSTQFLTSVYEDSGSWGYTRATAFAIGALQEVTGTFDSEVTVEVTWNEGDNEVVQELSIDSSNPENRTLLNDMDSEELEQLRGAADDETVEVSVERTDGNDENLIIVAIENEQVVSQEDGN